jgi:hypothetical protein
MGEANTDSQTTSALWLILLVSCNTPLTQAWSQQLNEDQFAYFKDSLSISTDNPWAVATATAAAAQTVQDQASMNAATSFQTNMVQEQKSLVSFQGQAMNSVFDAEDPLAEVLKETTNIILSFAT